MRKEANLCFIRRRKTWRHGVQWEIVTFVDEPTHGAWERFAVLCQREGGAMRQNLNDHKTPIVWLKDGAEPCMAPASYERKLG